MTYDEYIKIDKEKHEFYANESNKEIQRIKQKLLSNDPYINSIDDITININRIPFNEEFKRDEYNQLVQSYNNIINQLSIHPLYKNQISIIDEPIVDEPIDIDIQETPRNIKLIEENEHSKLRIATEVYFNNHFTDDNIKQNPFVLLEILLNSPPYQIIEEENVVISDEFMSTFKDEGLKARLQHNDKIVIDTYKHIMSDFTNQIIKSPSHVKNMIVYLNKYITQYLNYPNDFKGLFTEWNKLFGNICTIYQQQKKNDNCKNIPENMDEILISTLTGYIKGLFNEEQKDITMEKYIEISNGFSKFHKNQYVIPLYFSMFLLYAPVRPNVIQELYFNPNNEQNGFTIDEHGWHFIHNIDKNVNNDKNSSKILIENPIIIQLLDVLLIQKIDADDNDNLIYTFKVNGKRNNHFNERVFLPVMKLLGDNDNCIKTYNDIRSLYATRDLNLVLENTIKRKHNFQSMLNCYYTKFGKRIN